MHLEPLIAFTEVPQICTSKFLTCAVTRRTGRYVDRGNVKRATDAEAMAVGCTSYGARFTIRTKQSEVTLRLSREVTYDRPAMDGHEGDETLDRFNARFYDAEPADYLRTRWQLLLLLEPDRPTSRNCSERA